jgi:hypothetical protein
MMLLLFSQSDTYYAEDAHRVRTRMTAYEPRRAPTSYDADDSICDTYATKMSADGCHYFINKALSGARPRIAAYQPI